MTDFDREAVVGALEILGLDVETFSWYGDVDESQTDVTVFVGSAGSGSR